MADYNKILVLNCIAKSKEAMSDAEYGMKESRKSLVLNRLYYAVFYSVQGLGYQEGFVTSKHSQLIGWFNRKFIYENKIFPKRMSEIFKTSFINRQEADYELLNVSEITIEQLEIYLEDCKYFIKTMFEYLNDKSV